MVEFGETVGESSFLGNRPHIGPADCPSATSSSSIQLSQCALGPKRPLGPLLGPHRCAPVQRQHIHSTPGFDNRTFISRHRRFFLFFPCLSWTRFRILIFLLRFRGFPNDEKEGV